MVHFRWRHLRGAACSKKASHRCLQSWLDQSKVLIMSPSTLRIMPRLALSGVSAIAAIVFCSATPAFCESEMPAGGAFMSSYNSDPYFDPKSLYSQSHSAGDVQGQPMLSEPDGAPRPCTLFDTACADRFERSRSHAYPSPRADGGYRERALPRRWRPANPSR